MNSHLEGAQFKQHETRETVRIKVSQIEDGLGESGFPRTPRKGVGSNRDEIALHGQVITPVQHKVIQALSVFMLGLSLAAFVYAIIFKTRSTSLLFGKPHVQKVNVVFSAFTTTALGVLLIVFTFNLILVHRAELQWTRRKRCIVYVALAQLIVQFINSVFFMVPNASSLAKECTWFGEIEFASTFVRWSCWNSLFLLLAVQAHNISPWLDKTGSLRRGSVSATSKLQPLIIMDAPFWIHGPKFLVWLCFEFCIIFLASTNAHGFSYNRAANPNDTRHCTQQEYHCKPGANFKVLTTLWILFLVLYVFIIQAYIRQTRKRLLLAPYKDYVNVHLMVLRQKQQFWFLTVLGVMMVPVLWYTRWDRCNNYFVAWLGLLPLQVIATSVIFINAFYFMPMRPGNNSLQQAWLQEFSWLEANVKTDLEQRASLRPAWTDKLMQEPMFCFETAVKLLLWSELVYYDFEDENSRPSLAAAEQKKPKKSKCRCFSGDSQAPEDDGELVTRRGDLKAVKSTDADKGQDPPLNKVQSKGLAVDDITCMVLLKEAMKMYDLDEFEVIHEELLETRVLVAWSSKTVVVAFRGTAGLANVRSDAKAWRTQHPPVRGQWYLGTQPMVHKGFLETWQVNNLDKRVLARIKSIVEAGQVPADQFFILMTGHSLGGALATLAAIDLQREQLFPNLHVYTYGAPRTGNHAFAREYGQMVPNTWHVINDRDAVPRSGKFYVMYKRPGQRVLINQYGDIRVRPSVLEVCIHSSGFSIKQHYMASYLKGLWSILVAQCMPFKGLPGGRQGVEGLAASEQMQTYFSTLDLDIRELQGTPADKVSLPSLVEKEAKLTGWCNLGLMDFFSGVLEGMAPIGESAAATLSLIKPDAMTQTAEAAVRQEENQSEHLKQRLSAMNLRRMSVKHPAAPALPSQKAEELPMKAV